MYGRVGVLQMNQKIQQSKWTEDWINIQSITNGMIVLPNQEKVSGVKITPKNIFILDEDSQANTIIALRNFYNTLDYEFWLVVADRPVDINVYLSQLQLMYQKCTDGAIRKLIVQDINKANAFMGAEYNIVDTEYFLLFKDKKLDVIQKKLHNMIAGLANASINSTQVSNADLRMILDNFLNGGMTTTLGTVRPE